LIPLIIQSQKCGDLIWARQLAREAIRNARCDAIRGNTNREVRVFRAYSTISRSLGFELTDLALQCDECMETTVIVKLQAGG
jgi:hypothetical protein